MQFYLYTLYRHNIYQQTTHDTVTMVLPGYNPAIISWLSDTLQIVRVALRVCHESIHWRHNHRHNHRLSMRCAG